MEFKFWMDSKYHAIFRLGQGPNPFSFCLPLFSANHLVDVCKLGALVQHRRIKKYCKQLHSAGIKGEVLIFSSTVFFARVQLSWQQIDQKSLE